MKKNNNIGCGMAIVIALIILAALLLSYLLTTGIIFLICLAFGKAWVGWKISFGIWLCLIVVSSVFSGTATSRD